MALSRLVAGWWRPPLVVVLVVGHRLHSISHHDAAHLTVLKPPVELALEAAQQQQGLD